MTRDKNFKSSKTNVSEVKDVPSQPLNPWPTILLGRVIAGDGSNVAPITVSSSTRIQDAQRLSILGWVASNIEAAVRLLVGHLRISLLLFHVGVVVDEVVPARLLEFGRQEVQSWDFLDQVLAGVASSINQENFVARNSKVGGDRASSCA
ncbi:hypothetical protein HG531_009178 [Fusarium graminearum]|nr:hypothetical protein HG531_009178 [Fusarium graminearum]